MTDHNALWKEAKQTLKKTQPGHAYSTWFEPIKSIGLNDGTLLLELPNQFFYDWIQSHYLDVIDRACAAIHKENIVIK